MNKILLIDVDSKIPNLALMKISGYYKEQGYSVTLWQLGYNGSPTGSKKRRYINADKYEMVFVSCIISSNKGVVKVENCKDVFYGGSGYSLTVNLPSFIDDFKEDYSIYPDNDLSYGFITRGCIRDCDFCIVPQKEGREVYKYRDISQIVKHKKVRFLDNNILAYKNCKGVLRELVDKQIRCEFYQGLDIRLIDDEIAELLSKLNYMGEYTFAFDDIKMMRIIKKKMKILKRYIKKDWKIRMFLYCSADMLIKTNLIARVDWCKKNKILPYMMRGENCYKDKNRDLFQELNHYCNQPRFFKMVSFLEYLSMRSILESRKCKIKEIYEEG